MLDLSVPFIPVIMICREPKNYEVKLPEGISLRFWEPGLEEDWGRVHMAAGQLGTMEKALRIFNQEFAPYPEELKQRMFFLYEGNRPLATMTVWFGSDLGYPTQRLHWLSCVPDYQGKGLGKLTMDISLWLYHKLGCEGPLYLTSQTTSYVGINIYKKYGFEPYWGPMPDNGIKWDNETAWAIINEKLAQYQKNR